VEATWRPLAVEDVPALTRAFAAAEAVDDTGEHYSEHDVREVLEDEAIDIGRDTLAAFADDELVAFAWVYGAQDRVDAFGAVVPAARRRGLGRRLLAWAEERAAQRELPGAVFVQVHENNPGKQELVRAAGYEAARWEYRMTHGLDPLPDVPPTPAGFALAPYTTDRSEAVRHAHREAFAAHWGATPPDEQMWSQWYVGSDMFRPEISWLALRDGEVAAYVLSYFWEADAAATGVREAFLGQLGVREPFRRRGLGALLLATALDSYRTAGYERTSLTVDSANETGALGLYERLGFTRTGASVTWTKRL
jgi:mycothiol synthase